MIPRRLAELYTPRALPFKCIHMRNAYLTFHTMKQIFTLINSAAVSIYHLNVSFNGMFFKCEFQRHITLFDKKYHYCALYCNYLKNKLISNLPKNLLNITFFCRFFGTPYLSMWYTSAFKTIFKLHPFYMK